MYRFFEGSIFDKDRFYDLNVKLEELANKYNVSKCAIATAFILKLDKNISVITGSINKEHIKECLDGVNVSLSKEDWYSLYRRSGHMLP